MNLKLLIGDVQRRVKDVEEVNEDTARSEDQLHQKKLKLTAVLLLLQKEQGKYEDTIRIIDQMDSSWAGFPQQIAQLISAAQHRRRLQEEARVFLAALKDAQKNYVITWQVARLRKLIQQEHASQSQLLQAYHECIKKKIEIAENQRESLRQENQLYKSELDKLAKKAETLEHEQCMLNAQLHFTKNVWNPALEDQRLLVTDYLMKFRTALEGIQHTDSEVSNQLEEGNLQLTRSQQQYHLIQAAIREKTFLHEEAKKKLLQHKDQLVEEYSNISCKIGAMKTQIQASQQAYFDAVKTTALKLSLAKLLQQHHCFIQKNRAELERRQSATEEKLRSLQLERDEVVIQRMKASWMKACLENQAGQLAEESLTRRSLEEEVLGKMNALFEMEKAERDRIISHRPSAVEVLPMHTPTKGRVGSRKTAPHIFNETTNMKMNSVSKRRRKRNCSSSPEVQLSTSPNGHSANRERSLSSLIGCAPKRKLPRSTYPLSSMETASEAVSSVVSALPRSTTTTVNTSPKRTRKTRIPSRCLVAQTPLSRTRKPSASASSGLSSFFGPLGNVPEHVAGEDKKTGLPKGRGGATPFNEAGFRIGESPQPRCPRIYSTEARPKNPVPYSGASEISALTHALRKQRQATIHAQGCKHNSHQGSSEIPSVGPLNSTTFPLDSLMTGDDLFSDIF